MALHNQDAESLDYSKLMTRVMIKSLICMGLSPGGCPGGAEQGLQNLCSLISQLQEILI